MTAILGIALQYWKHLVVVLAVIGLVLMARHAWNERFQDGYDEGVRVTEEAQAAVIAQRMLDNEKRERELRNTAATIQAELEGKLHANEVIAENLRDQLRGRRVCLDEVRGDRLPSAPAAPAVNDGAASDHRPAETVGDRIVEIVEECQRSTDKLIRLQEWVRATAK